MKVLHIINSLEIGGAESLLAGLLESWSDEHHVVVLQGSGALGDRVRQAAASVSFIGASKSSRDLMKMIVGVQRAVNKVRPEILHSHLVQSDLVSLLVRGRGAARISSIHVASIRTNDSFRSRTTALLVARLSGAFSAAIATSDASLTYIQSLSYRCPSYVINNGTPLVERVAGDPHRVEFLSLARFHPVKQHSLLLKAFLLHLKSHPGSRLVCAGSGVDLRNPEFLRLVRSVYGNEVEGLPIEFLGPQLEVERLFRSASACVISSSSETFPMVGSESCMHGVPVITTDVGGAGAFALRKEMLVRVGSVSELATAMNYLAELSVAERVTLSNESREKAERLFDIKITSAAYREVYLSIVPKAFAGSSDN